MIEIEKTLKEKIRVAFEALSFTVDSEAIVIEVPKDEALGEFSTNIALKSANLLKMKAPILADALVHQLAQDSYFSRINVAGPGFINFFLSPLVYQTRLAEILELGPEYGDQPFNGIKLNLEYVSANPTGSLHLGHARGAALGDSLARIMRKAGYQVTREFYVNDAGKQIENLGLSLYARYLQTFGLKAELPADGYYGKDVVEIAAALKEVVGSRYLPENCVSDLAVAYFIEEGKARELTRIIEDLKAFRVEFDVFTNETAIRQKYNLPELIKKMGSHTYIEDGATFLKTSEYLDEKDRVIVKSDGSYTYLLPDIAYHLDKLSRGFNKLINILGADHHGYIPRITSSLMMFNYPQDILEAEIIQLVRIMQDGQEVKMSKRTGNAITLRELIEEVGVDAVRYFFVNRASSTHLDFDLNLALDKSNANPVYYAQYAHARLVRILEMGNKLFKEKADFSLLSEACELNLIKQLIAFGKVILGAASDRAPYKVVSFIQKLANSIHFFYTKSRILDEANQSLSVARLKLCLAAQIVLKSSLELIGVSAPLKM